MGIGILVFVLPQVVSRVVPPLQYANRQQIRVGRQKYRSTRQRDRSWGGKTKSPVAKYLEPPRKRKIIKINLALLQCI